MKTILTCIVMAFCVNMLYSCNKEDIIFSNSDIHSTEETEKPCIDTKMLSTDDIIKCKIDNLDMIIGTNNWYAIAHGNSKYIVVGEAYFTVSSDGDNWSTPKYITEDATDSGKQMNWNDIIFVNGRFIAVGYDNHNNSNQIPYIGETTDGNSWKITKFLYTHNGYDYPSIETMPESIVYDEKSGNIVIVGTLHTKASMAIVSTDNGGEWKSIPLPSKDTKYVAYGNGKLRTEGRGMYSDCFSTDGGLTWEEGGFAGLSIMKHGIAYGNDKFLTSTQYPNEYYGLDENTNFTFYGDLPIAPNMTVFVKDRFIILGEDGKITTSFDGKNWSSAVQISDNLPLRDACLVQ